MELEQRVKELETLVYCLLQREFEQDSAKMKKEATWPTFSDWKNKEMRKRPYYEAREQNRIAENEMIANGVDHYVEPFCLSFEEWEEYQAEKAAHDATLVGRRRNRMQQPFPRMIYWKMEKEEQPNNKRPRKE
jgi:hypothetical protein